MRPQFGVSSTEHAAMRDHELTSHQAFVPSTSIMFVSQASISQGVIETYSLRKRVEPVRNCRNVGKKDMKFNDVMPKMKVDPERYVCSLILFVHLERSETLTLSRPLKQMDNSVRLNRPRVCP